MKNKLADLNNHLFAQLERLGDESLSAEQVDQEVKRAGAIVSVAGHITDLANLQLQAARLYADHGAHILPMLPKVGGASEAPRE